MIDIEGLYEVGQHFAYRGSSYRRKDTALLKTYNWYGLDISLADPGVEGKSIILLFLMISTCLQNGI